MGLTVREKADTVGTFRFMSIYAMETLARWIPTTPELEVKVVFGRHVWDFAQHADALGRRTAELRAALHYNAPPVEEYQRSLAEATAATVTADRVDGIYAAVIPDLERRYHEYLASADLLLDEPTVRIMERIVVDLPRLRADATALRSELPGLWSRATGIGERVRGQMTAVTSFVNFRPTPPQQAGGLGS